MKNKLLYVGTFLLIAGLSASCTEEKDWSGGLKNSDLVFQTYLPTEGARGTVLSIRGNNFGEDVDQVQVWVNGKEAEVLSVAPTRISAKVAEESGSGVVKVRVGEREYSYPTLFSYGYIRSVYTVAGNGQNVTTDGVSLQSSVQWPIILAYDKTDDALFILQDEGEHRIRRIKNGKIETLCSTTSLMNNVRSICFSLTGDTLFMGSDNANDLIKNPVAVGMVTRKGGFKDLQAYIASTKFPNPHINGIAVNPKDGSLFTYHWGRHVYRYNKATETCEYVITKPEIDQLVKGLFPDAAGNLQNIGGDGGYGCLAFSPDGKTLYWGGRDPYQGVLKADYDLVTKKCSNLTRFAGNGVWGVVDGQGTNARMDQPAQIAVDGEGNLFVTTRYGRTVRKVTPAGNVSTYAGIGWTTGYVDGLALSSKFNEPYGIAVGSGKSLYVSDCQNWRIRQIKEE
ncbi:WD40 repeat protein [Bacteroides reticulotermitis]|uniref:WD40 repeat protein n=1 Tax=Bacteroides reticulotermitis TaxID=1133319 RepID=A0A840D701_9BACE|nr:IPT/TIG domain-containing protein [Bacteroides reticulotermitis]MBB4044193.1 WD40 repeat protein [Bacteroides reticulotermitis]